MTKQKFIPRPDTGRLSREDAIRYFSIFGFASFALGLINFAAQFLIVNLVYRFLPTVYHWPLFSPVTVIVTLYGFGLPVFYWILKKLPKIRPVREKQSFGFLISGLCICFGCVSAGSTVSNYLLYFFENLLGREVLNPVETSAASMPIWGTLLFSVILAPIMEELVFRKLLCDRLLPLGEAYAVILSASLFSLVHGNFYQIFYAFLIGVCLGYVYVKSGKISYTIGFHMAINLVFGFLPILMQRFLDMDGLTAIMDQMAEGEMMTEQMVEFMNANLLPMFFAAGLSLLQYGGVIAGTVLLIVFSVKKKFSFEEGILPPPADARVSPIFLNGGVALAIAAFTFLMIYSLL